MEPLRDDNKISVSAKNLQWKISREMLLLMLPILKNNNATYVTSIFSQASPILCQIFETSCFLFIRVFYVGERPKEYYT